jgi:chromosome segregation ATPase
VRRAVVALVALSVLTTNLTGVCEARTQRLSDDERRALCARAVEEVEASRTLLADLEARLATARKQLAVEEERNTLEARERALQEERIRLLGATVTNLEEMVRLTTDGIKRLEADVERLRGERDKARRRLKWAALGGAIGGAVLTVLALGAAE